LVSWKTGYGETLGDRMMMSPGAAAAIVASKVPGVAFQMVCAHRLEDRNAVNRTAVAPGGRRLIPGE
jgi:hypothetical protein